ncbi:MAG: hypothetical protein HYY32_00885 [Chloroflexi bacterium]|nr:hypothetical protein [Chloroflexota bacterium]
MVVEKANKPAVVLCAEGFEDNVLSAARSRGMPGFRFVSETVPSECSVQEKIEAGITEKVIDDIVKELTRPLTEEEKSPARPNLPQSPRIVSRGDIQEINRSFYESGWTDGMPIIPPTDALVADMLTGTDLPADHEVAELIPRLGKATVEKIAINAVMAGALPTHLPLIIAGVQILADPMSRFGLYAFSMGSWSPFWIVNGPVRHDVNVYGGQGALSPGRIANAALGRSLALIAKNIGGVRQGLEDMGVHGNPMKYSMVTGENEEESPWEPLHVTRGFGKEDSTITMFYPNSYVDVLVYTPDAKGILNTAIYNIPPARGGILCMLIPPKLAQFLADEGWSKKDIKGFIKEYTRCTPDKHWYHTIPGITKEEFIPFLPFSPTDMMPLITGDDQIEVVVSGKHTGYIGLTMGCWHIFDTFVTKKVEFPANWTKLVAKYKDMVPHYAEY